MTAVFYRFGTSVAGVKSYACISKDQSPLQDSILLH